MNQKLYCRKRDPKSPPPETSDPFGSAAILVDHLVIAKAHAEDVVNRVLKKVADDEEWDADLKASSPARK